MSKKLVGAAVMAATLLTSVPQAEAGLGGFLLLWQVNRVHNHYASLGSRGSHGSAGSHGSWGIGLGGGGILAGIRDRRAHGGGLLARLHARKGHGGGYGSHGSHGSWGSHGSHGSWGSHGSHGSWGGSHGSFGSYGWSGGGVMYDPAIGGGVIGGGVIGGGMTDGSGGGELVEPPAPPKENVEQIRFDIEVPADAAIFINGKPTDNAGTLRTYVSRNVKAETAYHYAVRAELVRNGQVITRTRTLELRAGQSDRVAFDFPADQSQTTTVVLHVPEDAKVTMAGVDTDSSGETREFVTTLLKNAPWADYPVRVELEKDGQTLVQERTVTLKPGDRQELKFDFDSAKVARSR